MALLYKQNSAWGLPSLSPADVQVEAYLRLAEIPFHEEVCSSSSRGPTGQLPAIEKDALVAGREPSAPSSRSARDACFKFLRRYAKDLDGRLTVAQKAEVLAYTALIETRLEPALLLSYWCEPKGFRELRKAMQLPFPLNYLLSWIEQREVARRYEHLNSQELYADAEQALDSIADRMEASRGPFFLGPEPCSVDALLVGVLLHMQRSPAALPALREKVAAQPALVNYLDNVMSEYFAEPAPRLTPEELASRAAWGAAAAQAARAEEPKPDATPVDKQLQRGNYLWMLGVGAAAVAYLLLGGQHLKFQFRPSILTAGPGGDDDDDDEDEDEEQ